MIFLLLTTPLVILKKLKEVVILSPVGVHTGEG